MQVSFVIPLYNCLPLTQAMLASLQATLPPGLEHEILLVDDGSSDGTREWLATLSAPCRILLNDANAGFATTCNRGAAAATGDFLFFLNNDLVLLPHWFQPMLALLHEPRTGLVGNIQLNARTGAVDHAGLWFNRQGQPVHTTAIPLLSRWSSRLPVAALTGACFAVRRTLWEQQGGFDEGFRNGGEDVDLCLRVRQAGWLNFVVPRSLVRHHISQSPNRKRHDEANSRRLLARWRTTIAELAARDACLHCWDHIWNDARNHPHLLLVWDGIRHLCWLERMPSSRLVEATSTGFDIEFRRWARLLDGDSTPDCQLPSPWQQIRRHLEPSAMI